jgi:hypothetical protein
MKYISGFVLAVAILFLAGCPGPNDADSGQSVSTGGITGKVLLKGSAAHAGIAVTLEKTDGLRAASLVSSVNRSAFSRSVTSSTITADDGSYEFSGIDPGTYTIYAASRNTQEKSVTTNVLVESGRVSSAIDLILTPTGNLTGKIIVNDNTENAGILVFISSTSLMAMTDSAGSFTISDIPVNDEGYQLIVMKGEYTTVWGTHTITAGSTIDLGTKDIVTTASAGIQWQGSLAAAPEDPQANWAYYDTAQKKSFIWDGAAWRMIAQDGGKGDPGDKGDPGEQGADGTNGRDGTNGQDGANGRDGTNGSDGANGSDGTNGRDGASFVWKGALSEAPENPQLNWAYYNITQRASYIWDGAAWQTLSQDSQGDSQGTPIFIHLADLSSWLNNQSGGYTIMDPVFVAYAGSETPTQLYEVLGTARKYVDLDLSLSSITNFNFGTEEGRNYIVSLLLPRTVVIAAGTESNPTFNQFINLKTISGINVNIGAYAFAGLTNLSSVKFSTNGGITIGEGVFMGCTDLGVIEIPQAERIGKKAFMGCVSLVSLDLPEVLDIYENAFNGCTNLLSMNIPAVTNIKKTAFQDCIRLTSITIGNAQPSIDTDIFNGAARTERTITIYVSAIYVYENWYMKSNFGANNSVNYYWDKTSAYRSNLTVSVGVTP